MGRDSNIEWTDHTFNPWWGCAKVSPACAHCYAESFANRLGFDNEPRDDGKPVKPKLWSRQDGDGERRTFGADHWQKPRTWNKQAEALGQSQRVFCASMADVFEDHPTATELRPQLWQLIRETPWLDWMLLTKRPENIERMLPADWGDGWEHVWLGVTVENQRWSTRIDQLLQIPAELRFVSCEPLLGKVDLVAYLSHFWYSTSLDWVICGGESGPKARPMDLAVAVSLRDQAAHYGTAYFFKQMGGSRPKSEWAPIPSELRIQEHPRPRRTC